MSIFDKAKIKTAIQGRSNMKFDTSHITTSDFFQLNPVYIRELVPNQHFEIDVNTFSRLAPVKLPTFGDCEIKHHAFFVPMRTIMPSFNDFITDTPRTQSNSTTYGIPTSTHRFQLSTLTKVYSTSTYSTATLQTDEADFSYIYGSGSTSSPYTTEYRNFTYKGRQLYKLMTALGYPFSTDLTTNIQGDYVSALPLLAFARLYLDWFFPSNYVGDPAYTRVMSILKRDSISPYTLSEDDIKEIANVCLFVSYDSDYFTSAFDNPAGPNNGLFSSFDISDVSLPDRTATQKSSVTTTQGNGTPTLVRGDNNSAVSTNVSQYILDSLHALSDYMKRHQLVGSRAVERFLARWGVNLGTDKTDRSYHLGSYNTPVQFGAVMSNSDTEGASLGQYAGQGFSANFNDNGHFVVDTKDDFGYIIITTSIVPKIGYVQGVSRRVLHMNKLDFFTPEFDALGTQPISLAELYYRNDTDEYSPYGATDFNSLRDKVFGFTPRYSEYKTSQCQLTGDFRLKSKNIGFTSDAWHLFRMFDPEEFFWMSHSYGFLKPDSLVNGTQFDRIFDYTGTNADHFVNIHRFKVSTSFPGKSMYETYDFDNEKGQTLLIEANGTRMN